MGKIIIYLGVILLYTGLCVWGGYSYNSHKYRNQVSAVREQLEAEVNRYRELQKVNSDLVARFSDLQEYQQREISDYIRRLESANEIVGTISDGLSGDIEDLSDVIRAIRELKEKIKSQQGLE